MRSDVNPSQPAHFFWGFIEAYSAPRLRKALPRIVKLWEKLRLWVQALAILAASDAADGAFLKATNLGKERL